MDTHEKVNILMVDDQPAKLLSYEAILGELGENLIKAGSGKEALEILLKKDIAVVLMDVSMPELDGFQLADMIQEHPRFQKVAIIFISAVHLTDLDRIKAYQRGAVDYISVPVSPELLRAKVSVFAELHRKARQLEALNRELRQLSASMIAAQDEERRRIARELHDSFGQDLAAAKMILETLEEDYAAETPQGQSLASASAIIHHAIQQVRNISYLLHPPMLDEVGLGSALQWYLDGVTERAGIQTSLDLQPKDFPRLAPEVERAVFRIIQEALTNVFRHSGANTAWVSVVSEGGRVTCTVCDDGKGIPEQVLEFRAESIGIGIAGMRQRVKEFGGELQLRNTGSGALLVATIPIVVDVPQTTTFLKVTREGYPAGEPQLSEIVREAEKKGVSNIGNIAAKGEL
jgi:signal transduction histidine kinase